MGKNYKEELARVERQCDRAESAVAMRFAAHLAAMEQAAERLRRRKADGPAIASAARAAGGAERLALRAKRRASRCASASASHDGVEIIAEGLLIAALGREPEGE